MESPDIIIPKREYIKALTCHVIRIVKSKVVPNKKVIVTLSFSAIQDERRSKQKLSM